jgi:Spy/CpxP family protein refolding chaperone
MKRTVFWVAATLAVSGSAFALAAAAESDQPSHAERMRHWAADRETMLDAKLAGMKAGLQLTSDQDKLWVPFESAVKDAAKARADAMQQMMQAREQGDHLSPIDHLEAMADRLSQGAADIKKIAEAAKPLYASLDDSQKHRFGMLGRMLMPEQPRSAMEMIHHHMGDDNGAE